MCGVLALLDEAQKLSSLGKVSEEGDFWETRNLDRLTKEVGDGRHSKDKCSDKDADENLHARGGRLTSGSHQGPQIHAWNRRAVGLLYDGLADYGCHRYAHETGKPDDGNGSRAINEDPDSHDGAHSGVYFHGRSVAPHGLRVLIERIAASWSQPMQRQSLPVAAHFPGDVLAGALHHERRHHDMGLTIHYRLAIIADVAHARQLAPQPRDAAMWRCVSARWTNCQRCIRQRLMK